MDQKPYPKPPKKVLIIRFSSIGDIVLTSPVVRCIHQQWGAEVHFLTKNKFSSIIGNNPFIKKVYTIQKKVSEVLALLKAEKYELIIDLHNNIRSFQVKSALSCPSRTFDKLNYKKWLMTRFKWNRLPDLHIVERYMATVEPLGIKNDQAGLDYFIPEKEEINIPLCFKELPVQPNNPFIAFAIGAAHATKRLPIHKIIELIQKLPLPVILLGGPDDASSGEQIKQGLQGKKVINACGRLSLHQSASVVRQAAYVITHDTGMMHIATAFKKRIISIWGNTIPAFGMYPYLPGQEALFDIIEVDDLSCRPCSKIGYQKCPKGHFKCMNDIDLDQITDLVAKK